MVSVSKESEITLSVKKRKRKNERLIMRINVLKSNRSSKASIGGIDADEQVITSDEEDQQ